MLYTKEQIKVFEEETLKVVLDYLREGLGADIDHPELYLILGLLLTLILSFIALRLPSLDGNGEVIGRLFSIIENVQKGTIKLDVFRPLVRRVVDKSSDPEIWEALLDIINSFAVSPINIAPPFEGTAISTSLNRLSERENSYAIEDELFQQMNNCTFRNVGGFWEKFFDPKRWHGGQEAMLEAVLTAHDGKKWKTFPEVPNRESVWNWLRSLQESFLDQAPYKFQATNAPCDPQNPRKQQMDLFLQRPAAEGCDTLWYKYIFVVGVQKEEPDNTCSFKAGFLPLARHVRGIFTDQPTRRIVHAFSLCASQMELWIFDRSGAYSSGTFDIHDEPGKFARALVGYATMDDDSMGLDTFMEQRDGGCYITSDGKEAEFRLDKALTRQQTVVCHGNTCYETQDGHRAKFSWTSNGEKPEIELLKRVEAMGVEGVVRFVARRQITTVAEMREGIRFPVAHRFRDEGVYLSYLPAAMATPRKRRYPADCTSGHASGEHLWENKIYTCLVVSPNGRALSDFHTIIELLEAERDAIKAHRSLYVSGKTLHCNISLNNIIITDPKAANGFKGMLVNLDSAKVLDSEPSTARHPAGTLTFMAVEVLRKKDHTYRHDLESFFYVLLWICARQAWCKELVGGLGLPKYSCVLYWKTGSLKDIADVKQKHMTERGLEYIMKDFPQALNVVKPLCVKIRKILFPLDSDGSMVLGTPVGDPDQLYTPMIAAFDEAISML